MLSGIRILEVEGLGPGPFAAMLLADLGADVIVVHRKGGAVTPGLPNKSILDRGKRSIELDLKNAEDVALFKKLVAKSHGLIEGFRPGTMEKLGLGPDICHQINPALVFARMTGWGQDGPLASVAGHDLNYIGLSGALHYASPADQPPIAPPTLVGDIGGGAMYLVTGLLAGIINAQSSGQGTVVDAAIYDGSAHMMNLIMTLRQSGGFSDKRGESLLDGPHWSRTYRTKEGGYMSVQCLEPKFYALFLKLLGLENEEAFQAQFDTSSWPALTARLETIFLQKSRAEWEQIFGGTDACVAPVLSPNEAASHPMNAARQVWHHQDGHLQAAPAPRFSTRDQSPPAAISERGADRADILASLDLS